MEYKTNKIEETHNGNNEKEGIEKMMELFLSLAISQKK